MSAEDVLKKVDEKWESIEDMKGICRITMSYLGVNASTEFEFAIKKPDKFRISHEVMNFTMIENGSNIVIMLEGLVLPLNASTNKSEIYKEKELANPVEHIRKHYGNCSPRLVSSEGGHYIIEFVNESGTTKVWVSKKLWYPVKIVKTKKTPFGNATTIIEFRNLEINIGLSDELFKIPKKPMPNITKLLNQLITPVITATPTKPTKRYAVTVKILGTNNIYTRCLGIAINSHLKDRWWKNEGYTCNFIISRYDIGREFKCYSDEPIKYAEVSVSAFANYTWTIEVMLPNGKSKICTVNVHTRCVISSENTTS